MYAIRPLTETGEPLGVAIAFTQQELIIALMLALERSPHVYVVADKDGAASECVQTPANPAPTINGEAQPTTTQET